MVKRALCKTAFRLTNNLFSNPRWLILWSKTLNQQFQQLFSKYHAEDPAVNHKLPQQIETTAWINQNMEDTAQPHQQTCCQSIRDLTIIAFFFLLCIRQYTPKAKISQYTMPVRKCDIQLWKNHVPISRQAPLTEMLQANAVAIHIPNQKNGEKEQCLVHASTNLTLDPVKAAARHLDNDENTNIHNIKPKQIKTTILTTAMDPQAKVSHWTR